MKLKILAGLCLISSLLVFPFPSFAQSEKNAFCPVMPGTRISKKFFAEYQGKKIYLCCKSCVKAFKRNPEKYLHRPGPKSSERG